MQIFQDIEARPYQVDEILGKSLRGLFGPRFWDLFAPIVLIQILFFIVGLVVMQPMSAEYLDMFETAPPGEAPDSELLGDFWRVLAFQGVFWVFAVLVSIVALQYVLFRIRHMIYGEDVPVSDTLRAACDPLRGLAVLLTGVVGGLAVGLGFMFCILPGIYLAVVFSVLPACVVFHEQRFAIPLNEPFRLMEGNLGKTFLVLLIIVVVTATVGFIVALPAQIFAFSGFFDLAAQENPDVYMEQMMDRSQSPLLQVFGFVSGLITSLVYLFEGIVIVVMYLNYRARPAAAASEVETA